MIGESADYDGWRIESMELACHYDELEGAALDVYRLGWRLHTTTPDRVILAGGMEMDEEGWVLATYPNSTYLIFDVSGGEAPVYLFSSMVNDCAPGSELFTETIRRPLQWALLQDQAEGQVFNRSFDLDGLFSYVPGTFRFPVSFPNPAGRFYPELDQYARGLAVYYRAVFTLY